MVIFHDWELDSSMVHIYITESQQRDYSGNFFSTQLEQRDRMDKSVIKLG
jgi:hypothetical protein